MKTSKKITFSLAISLIIIIIMLILPRSVFAVKGSVTVDGVRVRREPSTESEILTDVYKTDSITVVEKVGDWYKVIFGEYTGYMSAAYVMVDGEVPSLENTNENNEQKTEVQQENNQQENNNVEQNTKITEANVYMIPVLYSTKIDKITILSNAEVLKTINNWIYIKYGEKTGWVIKSIFEKLSPIETTETPAQTSNTTEQNNPVPTEKKGYINVSSAIVRATPSLEGEILLGLARNTEVTIIEEGAEWNKIKTTEVEGYVAKRLISDQPTETTSRSLEEQRQALAIPYYVNVATANIRAESNTSSEKLGYVSRKEELLVVGEENGFYKIKYKDGYAYVKKDLVVDSIEKVTEPVITSSSSTGGNYNPPSSGSGQGIVDYAMQFVGYRYVYGGESPSGFDCSGFVYYILNNCGYSLGRTISSQMAAGAEVSRSNLQPGDVIVFNDSSNSSIGHTGIYIGDGRMVHAANPSRGVVTDSITSGYYDVRYVTARRY